MTGLGLLEFSAGGWFGRIQDFGLVCAARM